MKHPNFDSPRDVVRWIRSRGWTKVRQGGKHEVWRAPNGHQMTIPRGSRGYRNIATIVMRIEKRDPFTGSETVRSGSEPARSELG